MRKVQFALLAAIVVSALTFSATQAAASVAYIDGNEVWVSSDDGARKVRLSAGENDWREVAQSDLGYIVGVRREANMSAIYASFTVWDPSGAIVHFGSLSGDYAGSNAYPLSIDITPSGGNLVYGFSHSVYSYPVSTLTEGTYVKATADPSTTVPVKLTTALWPTLVGTRIVGADTSGSDMILVQDPSSIADTSFYQWIDTSSLEGYDLKRTDAAAAGGRIAIEFGATSGGGSTVKLAVGQSPGIGLPGNTNSCFLPTQGNISNSSLSQDGGLITWADQRGVLISSLPAIPAQTDCPFGGSPTVISATGTYPSYGPFSVPSAQSGGIGGPTVRVPSKVKLATALKSGLKVTVTSPVSGKAKLKLTIKPSRVGKRGKKPITLATGSANVVANQAKSIKLKFTSTGKRLKKRLKGKKASLKVTVGKTTTTKSLKFR